ncbi:hypothetical protein AEQU_2064 [Adlercreutzia equolifaciens DSM 19450]|nr:hypothetical protein AEQU_2064 [Adlercreutzia equolifaciens DSM 19450]
MARHGPQPGLQKSTSTVPSALVTRASKFSFVSSTMPRPFRILHQAQYSERGCHRMNPPRIVVGLTSTKCSLTLGATGIDQGKVF